MDLKLNDWMQLPLSTKHPLPYSSRHVPHRSRLRLSGLRVRTKSIDALRQCLCGPPVCCSLLGIVTTYLPSLLLLSVIPSPHSQTVDQSSNQTQPDRH